MTNEHIRSERKKMKPSLKSSIMYRDGYSCQQCGRSPANGDSTDLHVDHIVPVSKGGKSTPDNLQTLCSDCNLHKGAKIEARLNNFFSSAVYAPQTGRTWADVVYFLILEVKAWRQRRYLDRKPELLPALDAKFQEYLDVTMKDFVVDGLEAEKIAVDELTGITLKSAIPLPGDAPWLRMTK